MFCLFLSCSDVFTAIDKLVENFSINNSLVQKLKIRLTIPKNCTYLSTMQEFVSFYQIALYLKMVASLIEHFTSEKFSAFANHGFSVKNLLPSWKFNVKEGFKSPLDFKNFEINSDWNSWAMRKILNCSTSHGFGWPHRKSRNNR